jgi:hypothetical protein
MQILIAGKPITEKRIPMPRGKPGAEVVMKYVIIAPK